MKRGDQAIGNSSRDGLLVAGRNDGSRMARWHCPEGRGGIPPLSRKNIWAPPALGQLLLGPLPAGSFGSHILAVWKATSPSHQLGSWPLQSNWRIPVMRCCFSASGDNGTLPFGRAGLLRGHFRNGAETESSAIFRVETCCGEEVLSLRTIPANVHKDQPEGLFLGKTSKVPLSKAPHQDQAWVATAERVLLQDYKLLRHGGER